MNLSKKLQYFALTAFVGLGAYQFNRLNTRQQEKFAFLNQEIKNLRTENSFQNDKMISLEEQLKEQQELSNKNYENFFQKLEIFDGALDTLYRDQNFLRTDLETLASSLREENLSQNEKITLLNKYSFAVKLILNKENHKIKELIEKDENIASLVNDISSRIENYRTSVLEVSARLQNQGDTERAEKIIAPTVRISCHLEVGSGTINYCKQEGEIWNTYAITAGHVVQGAKEGRPIQVTVFNANEEEFQIAAELIGFSEELDLAVIKLENNSKLYSAEIATKSEINNIKRFDDVYAVGCPLGYMPIQTEGEITSQNKILNGKNYWMVSAETIFGNSGGGIFLKENNEMIGVLTRVSAYNNFINVAVPHMGIVVPLDRIYKWLEEENLEFLYDSNFNREECFRKRAEKTGHHKPVQEVNDPTSVKNVLR